MLSPTAILLALVLVCTCSTHTTTTSTAAMTTETTFSSTTQVTEDTTANVTTTSEGNVTESSDVITTENSTSWSDVTTESSWNNATDNGTNVTDDVSTTAPMLSMAALCEEPTLDAAVMGADGTGYAFKGRFVLEFRGAEPPRPRPLLEVFPGGPSSVDAALTLDTRLGPRTLLFQGKKLWAFRNGEWGLELEGEGPFTILSQLGVAGPLDAAFSLSTSRSTFFLTKGRLTWRLKLSREGRLRVSKPRARSDFRELKGLPDFTSVVLKDTGLTYLLSHAVHYVMKEGERVVGEAVSNSVILGCLPAGAKPGVNGSDANPLGLFQASGQRAPSREDVQDFDSEVDPMPDLDADFSEEEIFKNKSKRGSGEKGKKGSGEKRKKGPGEKSRKKGRESKERMDSSEASKEKKGSRGNSKKRGSKKQRKSA